MAEAEKSVLISGASFAGLATAWWMQQLGYRVTVVEIAPALKKGGTPVDIRESVVEVAKKMGLLEQIIAASLPSRPMAFLGETGLPLGSADAQSGDPDQAPGWEIERDDLLDMLFSRVQADAEFLFNNKITNVEETAEEVTVTLATGERRSVNLLFGCDGTHSAVRRLCFGEESSFLFFMKNYFSLTILDKLLIPENTGLMYSVPGKTVMLNGYRGKTDIGFAFSSADEISYDRSDREIQKQMVRDKFKGGAWRTEELLQEMSRSDNFYFDKLCQIRMPAWAEGRVALVGDAGYCPSPAAGMGGSMALLGAAALADAFHANPDDYAKAFRQYDHSFRPVVEQVQSDAVDFGIKMFLPTTEEELQQRNAQLNLR